MDIHTQLHTHAHMHTTLVEYIGHLNTLANIARTNNLNILIERVEHHIMSISPGNENNASIV